MGDQRGVGATHSSLEGESQKPSQVSRVTQPHSGTKLAAYINVAGVIRPPRPGPRFLQGKACTSCSPPRDHIHNTFLVNKAGILLCFYSSVLLAC